MVIKLRKERQEFCFRGPGDMAQECRVGTDMFCKAKGMFCRAQYGLVGGVPSPTGLV